MATGRSGRADCPRRRTTRTRSPSRSTASAGAWRGSPAARRPVVHASCRGFRTPGAWLIHRCSSTRPAAGADGIAGSARPWAFSARDTPSSWPPRSSRGTPARPGCRCPTPRTSSPRARSTPLSCRPSRPPGRRHPPPAAPRPSRLPLLPPRPRPRPRTHGPVTAGRRGRAVSPGVPYRRRGAVTRRVGSRAPRGRVPRAKALGPAVSPARVRVGAAAPRGRPRPAVTPRLPGRIRTAGAPRPRRRAVRLWLRPRERRTVVAVVAVVPRVAVVPGRMRVVRRGPGCEPWPTGGSRGTGSRKAYAHELPFRWARVGRGGVHFGFRFRAGVCSWSCSWS